MDGDTVEITCPTCFEVFGVPTPSFSEVPATVDYDCEVCCRPMVIRFFTDGELVLAEASSLDE